MNTQITRPSTVLQMLGTSIVSLLLALINLLLLSQNISKATFQQYGFTSQHGQYWLPCQSHRQRAKSSNPTVPSLILASACDVD